MDELPEDIVSIVKERILDGVRFDIERGCWLWQKALSNGYGTMGVPRQLTARGNRMTKSTHQLAYMAWRGPLKPGMHLDHEGCDTPQCCNPWHVEIRTPRQNALRTNKANSAGEKSRREVCVNGHDLTVESNVYRHPLRGTRHCVQCKRDRDRASYATRVGRPVRACRRKSSADEERLD